jgi:hypothetical protein
MFTTGSLEKMQIQAFSDQNFKKPVGKAFSVWINPASYNYKYQIKYNSRQAQGSNGTSPDFNKVATDTVTLDLMFDATGVIPSPNPSLPDFSSNGIADQMAAFQKMVFTYNGLIHSPNYLWLAWSTLQFQCRLQTLGMNYTLFMPDGTPLRAKVSCSFLGFTSETQLAKQANNSSPDLSHLVEVRIGDTLPALCDRIYGTSLPYLQVAAVNGLADFRNLAVGAQLLFPPLQGAGA